MDEHIRQYLKLDSLKTKQRLTSHFDQEIEEFIHLISGIITPLQKYLSTTTDYENIKYTSCGLMTRGSNTLMSAFELALNGYFWEPPMLLRNALEGFCTGWDILHNPKRRDLWNSEERFKSTQSITNCKEINPVIGNLYGLFSDMYSHVCKNNYSPSIIKTDENYKLQFFGLINPGKEPSRNGEIYLCILITYICLQITELSFYKYSSNLETIEKIPGEMKMKTKVSDRHKPFVEKATAVFNNWSKSKMEGSDNIFSHIIKS